MTPRNPVARVGAPCAVLVTAWLAACGGGSDSPNPPPPQPPPPPPSSGLDSRPDNATCVAGDRPSQSVALGTQRAFASLPPFTNPVLLLQAPNDASRWFVVEQGGVVRAFANQAGVASSVVFVDITTRVRSGGEQGLLGLAFHPDFPADPRVYLSYTNATNGLVSRISEFRTRDGGETLDPASEQVLLSVPQPATNHNGGHIVFGPDGFLYGGLGDGGSGGDPWGAFGNGQNLQTTLGKMLRIDVDGVTGAIPYRIPADNPYAGNAPCNAGTGAQPCPEIYAYGFRNPWRWSFDADSGELWVADVGQGTLEEVNRVVRGGNYGWRCFEGTNAFNANCGPNAASSLPPVAQYGRSAGQSVTGGFVYRGTATPVLAGRYVFGDFVTGRIWHIARDTAPTLTVNAGFDSGLSIASFGQGLDGELYVVHYGGTLHRLVAGATGGGSVETQLSATGCVLPGDASRPATGLIPYEPNAPFWSDGADKERFLALPNGATIRAGADGDLEFPVGTVLVKNFRLGTRRVETRLFMRHTDGEWAGYTLRVECAGHGCDPRDRRQDCVRRGPGVGLPERGAVSRLSHRGGRAQPRAGVGATERCVHVPANRPQREPGRHAQFRRDVQPRRHDRADGAAIDAGSVRHGGLPGRTRAGLSAHELRPVPSPERRHADRSRPALHDAARQHQRLRSHASGW